MFFSKFSKQQKETYLVCGLGNPGTQYDFTRHNAGFIAIEQVAKNRGVRMLKLKFNAVYGEGERNGVRIIFLKPQTFMNNSGEAVGAFARFYKVPPERVIVISDDVNLDPGVLRIRKSGTEGGHNGLKSITAHLGTNAYPRMRIGVGLKPEQYDMVDWVLGKLESKDVDKIKAAAEKIDKAIDLVVEGKTDLAMSKFNG